MPSIGVSITVDLNISYYENASGISEKDLIAAVTEYVMPERKALAQEIRAATVKLMAGKSLDE